MNFLRIILLAFVTLIFAFISVLNADVDEDCLCYPENGITSDDILALDSCRFFEIYGGGWECENLVFSSYGGNLLANTDSSFIYARRNILMTFKKDIFLNEFNEVDSIKSINDIKDEHVEYINLFKEMNDEFGEFNFFSKDDNITIKLQFEEFQSVLKLKKYLYNNETIKNLKIYFIIESFTRTTKTDVGNLNEVDNNFILHNDNNLQILNRNIKRISIYNYLGDLLLYDNLDNKEYVHLSNSNLVLYIIMEDNSNKLYYNKLILNKK